MAEPTDLTDVLEEAAQSPASASGDQGSVSARPLSDVIAADRYLREVAAAQRARTNNGGVLVYKKLVPPGAS